MSGAVAPPSLVFRRRSTLETLALDPALELGAGGEARVMAIPGDDSMVAKLYHEPTLAKARKVALMMADEPSLDASAAALAWPRDLLLEVGGGFAGFLMERAEGPRVFELYNPSTRRRAAPRSDHALLHRVGANVAAAFEALHARGYVIGDVNESNVLVGPGGTVTLVDTDSMQVPDPANGTVLRSRVGKPEFTPPELQGRPFGDFDRSPEHDRFGLAVLLFLLLMEGTHPFAGRMADGSEAPPIEERIRRGLFPHGIHGEIHPPKLAPSVSLLHPALRSLFARAFVDGHRDPAARPTAAEWRTVLSTAEAELETCAESGYHRFGAHLDRCPWCERAALLGGRDPFPTDAPPAPRRSKPGGVARRPVIAPSAPASPKAAILASAPVAAPSPLVDLLRRQGVNVPPWLQPALGPSGVQHPAAWVAPAGVLMFTAPTMIQVLCVLALFGAARWWLAARPGGRLNADTFCASLLMLAAAFLIAIGANAAATGSPSPQLDGRPAAIVDEAPDRGPVPAGVAARLESTSTWGKVDARPEMTNRAEVERLLTERLFHAGIPATPSATAMVWVLPDGTVDPSRMEPNTRVVAAAAPVLAMLRFQPLTRDGIPIGAEVWVHIEFDRPEPAPDR
jgi:hypothetical protein